MATDERCVVEVGVHPAPFYVRRSDGQPFCSRHASQMVEAGYDTPGDFVLRLREDGLPLGDA